jgi:hypothetical protein
VRDLVVRESLGRLAEEAGEKLRGLVAAGEELPFDVSEPGDHSPFAQFAPQTNRFIRSHATALLDLESFAPACSAIASAEVARPYLERLGEPIPNDPGRRAADAVVTFLCRIWEGSAEFALDPSRLEAALLELEDTEEPERGEAEVLVPMLGLQMPISRLELATASLVRAETIDAPQEARNAEGSQRSAWEPLFFAVVQRPLDRSGDGPGPALRELITSLRLFKPGSVGMGPHAWARSSGDRWRRISTGAGRPRPGSYWLTGKELSDLVDFSKAAAGLSSRLTLARAISRFEAGLERPALLDAVSDYVLALRMVLEGGGPAGLELPVRAAALRAEGREREMVRHIVERAVAMEAAIVAGKALETDAGSPLELVAELESVVRSILRDAVRGRHGADLRAAADETLLADGLAAGEGAETLLGSTAEWGAVGTDDGALWATENEASRQAPKQAAERDTDPEIEASEPPMPKPVELRPAADDLREELVEFEDEYVPARTFEQPTQIIELAPRTEDATDTLLAATDVAEEDARPEELDDPGRSEPAEAEDDPHMSQQLDTQPAEVADDWMSGMSSSDTLDWPERPTALRMLDNRPAERRAARNRVDHLFPRPEATDWSVRELDYNRRRARPVVRV